MIMKLWLSLHTALSTLRAMLSEDLAGVLGVFAKGAIIASCVQRAFESRDRVEVVHASAPRRQSDLSKELGSCLVAGGPVPKGLSAFGFFSSDVSASQRTLFFMQGAFESRDQAEAALAVALQRQTELGKELEDALQRQAGLSKKLEAALSARGTPAHPAPAASCEASSLQQVC
jgi:hypothetical protein